MWLRTFSANLSNTLNMSVGLSEEKGLHTFYLKLFLFMSNNLSFHSYLKMQLDFSLLLCLLIACKLSSACPLLQRAI